MITINDPPAIETVEREPDLAIATVRRESSAPTCAVDFMRGPTSSPISPADALLLTRLRWVAFVMLMVYGIALIWVLATRDDLHQPMVVLLGLRVTLVMIILGLLFGELAASPSHVRLFDLASFGGLTVCLTLSQYLTGRDWIRAGHLSGFMAHEKDGLIELLILMITYGLLIPSTPRRAATVVLTMALTPFLGLTVLFVSDPASAPVMAELGRVEHVGQNVLVVLSGAGRQRLGPEMSSANRQASP
jgi:hypothetical protein